MLAACLGCHAASPAAAYPTRPVRVLVGFAAGGGVDAVVRRIAQKLVQSLGQQVIIDKW